MGFISSQTPVCGVQLDAVRSGCDFFEELQNLRSVPLAPEARDLKSPLEDVDEA